MQTVTVSSTFELRAEAAQIEVHVIRSRDWHHAMELTSFPKQVYCFWIPWVMDFRAKGALTSKFADNHSTLFWQCRFTSSRIGHRARNSIGRLQKYSHWSSTYYQLTKHKKPNARQYIARCLFSQLHCVTQLFMDPLFGDIWKPVSGKPVSEGGKKTHTQNLLRKLLSKLRTKTFSRQRRTYVQICRQPQYSFLTMSVYEQSKWTPCAKF